MRKLEHYHFDCGCSSAEHTLRFTLDPCMHHQYGPELYAEIYLNDHRGFWKRLWYGLKYICGFKSRYGAWDIWTMKEDDAGRLRTLLDRYETLTKAYKEEFPDDKPKGYGTVK